MQLTNIGWTDFSANLLKYRDPDGNVVHACVRASEGCRNCYSSVLAGRWGRKGRDYTAENMKRLTPFFDDAEAKRVLGSKKIVGKRVFVDDMTDWMGPWVPDTIIDQHMAVYAMRPDVTFQTLTKHADRLLAYTQSRAKSIKPLEDAARTLGYTLKFKGLDGNEYSMVPWPLKNLHVGVSVEDQKNANQRIPKLLETNAAVRWISAEPLLGPMKVNQPYQVVNGGFRSMINDLDWIVVGMESGSGHRTIPVEHLIDIANQSRDARVPVFVKQDSGPRPGMQGRIPDDIWKLKEWPARG